MRSPKVPAVARQHADGLHLHYLAFVIVLLLLSGFLGFAIEPVSGREFALWIHLRDVY